MDQCLQTSEIVHLICEESTKSSAVSMALTCRGFLQPGLDRIWREIDSFDAITACLPSDLWIVKQTEHKQYANADILFLARAITPADIERYQTHYAPRIRVFRPTPHSRFAVSVEALAALQMVTKWQRGALTPLLTSLSWFDPTELRAYWGTELGNGVYPYISLFLADTLASINFTLTHNFDNPLHLATAQSAFMCLPRLENLSLDIRRGVEEEDVVDNHVFLASSHGLWDCLRVLHLSSISTSAVPALAKLPSLTSLALNAILPSIESGGYPQVAGEGFHVLRNLVLGRLGERLITRFFRYVSVTNPLQTVDLAIAEDPRAACPLQVVLDVLAKRLNPQSFECLTILDAEEFPPLLGDEDSDGSLDDNMDDLVDISSLFHLKNMKVLRLDTRKDVQLTPEDASDIPRAWPFLRILDLGGQYPRNRCPLINHSDILSVLEGCPYLTILRLHFDSSGATGKERSLSAPFHLRELHVGNSPVNNPSRVLAFLESNFEPEMVLRVCHPASGLGSVFEQHWATIQDNWLKYRIDLTQPNSWDLS